jgi:GDP-4-dehydro-6-deoxy-D-mannose reductase
MLSYWRRFGLDVLVARLFNVDGPELSMELAPGRWRRLVAELPDGAFLDVGNLEALRDYLPINSAAKDVWKVALHGVSGSVYNVCSGVPLAMADLLSAIIAESGKRIVPRKCEALYRVNDVPVIYGDRSRLEALGI